MSSPCLSGGGRSYGFELERVKPSPSAASTATASASAITSSLTSSPSSTLSESSNSPLAISTRKPRTPRKRPNQTYNEAAALLSTVYPNIFSTSHHKFTAPAGALLLDQPSDLLLSPFPVFDTPGFLLHHHQSHHRPIHKPDEPRLAHLTIPSYQSCGEVDSPMETTDSTNSMEVCEEEDDFDTGSILDEEIGEGIDSIMGNLSVASEMAASSGGGGCGGGELNSWRSMGYNYGGRFQPGIRAFRNLEERNWWCFPIVDMLQISPRLSSNREPEKEKNSTTQNSNSNTNPKLKPEPDASEKRKKKKKKKVVKKAVVAELEEEEVDEVEKNWNAAAAAQPDKQSLILKLNYKDVLDAWSDRGSPYSDQGLGSADGKDAAARLALIDLFSEGGGGIREASVLRYKEKRRTRLFFKKIRYQVRKVNADRRPRMKGRFVRRLNSSSSGQRREK